MARRMLAILNSLNYEMIDTVEINNNEFNENFDWGIINRNAEASSKTAAMNIHFNSELQKMKREINYYKTRLRICRDKYENAKTEICDVRRLQCKDNVQLEEEDIRERLKNIHLSYEMCIEKSSKIEKNQDCKDLDKTIRAKISELTILRKTLIEELMQLRKNADDNAKKLARVNAILTEQEEKNATLFREFKEKI